MITITVRMAIERVGFKISKMTKRDSSGTMTILGLAIFRRTTDREMSILAQLTDVS